MKLIAMIPARLDSKRIPRKNLRLLQGKPLLQYAIEIANTCGALNEVWVNSESDKLGELAVGNGARFHKRPAHLSTDSATNQSFTAEFLQNHECDFVVMVNSTSPLATVDSLSDFCEMVLSNKYDTVLSVVDEFAECFYEGRPVNFLLDKKVNSQDLSPVRKIVWAFTAWRRNVFLNAVGQGLSGSFAGNIGLFSIPKDESCDLDVEEDWNIAEGMLTSRLQGPVEPEYWNED